MLSPTQTIRTLLFDIDGTLLRTNEGGRGALESALEDEFQLDAARVDIPFCGRTDRQILNELLIRNQLPPSDSNRQRLQQRYLSFLPAVLTERGGEVLPGVMDVLRAIADDSRVCVSVMTGNLHESATFKLSHFGLSRYFRWIVGGDHDCHRDDLARRAMATIRDAFGDEATEQVMVIGDTPADIRCGHAIGARTIGVCTGRYDRQALEAENPHVVLDDLSDVAQVCSLFVS
ncbi:HAD family hydrolase [Novipirellula artificiosorum]|uniref:phosphoglycolate phosphatase n=1 Tax=Novipirellula artificiosorum TaxID=2528016 RepID=A0A5C6DAJ8_9BACT|nr:HAD family hydrolase [Novipirellula artificiosorum]TWU32811.1 Phosphoglycolate phosphatase [Novipirellula artificiosorum]